MAQTNVHRKNVDSMIATARLLDKMGVDPSKCLFYKKGYYKKAVEAMGDWRNSTPIQIR